jgi:membrane protein YdbS with pleckstrin-like domain
MSTDRAAAAVYRGVWRRLGVWFKVPAEPPALPTDDAEPLRKIHPAPGFLRYLKLKFWVGLTALDGALLIVWLGLSAANPRAAAILLVPALLIAIVPDVVVYIALQLRYDTTWYVMSSRSLRIRRGIWVLREMTITFENVQNIKVTQGPLMRLYGIKNLVVETAGAAAQAEGPHGRPPENQAVLEGLDDADAIRDSILARVRASRSAGLGDEARAEVEAAITDERHAPAGWTPAQVQVLREIRDEAALLAR